MSAHTPGPWETSVNDEGQWDVCAAGGGDMVADLSDCPESAEANARLIAAAPDLLAALTFYVGICGNTGATVTRQTFQEMYAQAVAAIAKAEGEP